MKKMIMSGGWGRQKKRGGEEEKMRRERKGQLQLNFKKTEASLWSTKGWFVVVFSPE